MYHSINIFVFPSNYEIDNSTGIFTFNKINTFNTYDDFHLIPLSRPIVNPPNVKTTMTEVPLSNGSIDLTNSIVPWLYYSNRSGSFDFAVENNTEYWAVLYSRLLNSIHGKKCAIQLEDDKAWFYYGRIAINKWEPSNDGKWATVSIDYDLYPYKMENIPNSDYYSKADNRWLWDPFSFINGIIYQKAPLLVYSDELIQGQDETDIENDILTLGKLDVKISTSGLNSSLSNTYPTINRIMLHMDQNVINDVKNNDDIIIVLIDENTKVIRLMFIDRSSLGSLLCTYDMHSSTYWNTWCSFYNLQQNQIIVSDRIVIADYFTVENDILHIVKSDSFTLTFNEIMIVHYGEQYKIPTPIEAIESDDNNDSQETLLAYYDSTKNMPVYDDSSGEDDPISGGDDNPSSGDDNPSSGGDDPISGGDDNPSSGDDPISGGNDNPSSGDDPISGGNDNPSSGGNDNPSSGGNDNPSSGGDDPISGGDDPISSGEDDPISGGNDNPSSSDNDDLISGGDDEIYIVDPVYSSYGLFQPIYVDSNEWVKIFILDSKTHNYRDYFNTDEFGYMLVIPTIKYTGNQLEILFKNKNYKMLNVDIVLGTTPNNTILIKNIFQPIAYFEPNNNDQLEIFVKGHGGIYIDFRKGSL